MTRATFNLIEFDEIDLARQIEFGSTHFAELPTEARQLEYLLKSIKARDVKGLNLYRKLLIPVTWHIQDRKCSKAASECEITAGSDGRWEIAYPNLKKKISLYLKLSKAKLSGLVVLSAMAGYALAPESFNLVSFACLTLGTSLCSGAANSFNQFIEVPFDSQMSRTRNRVLVQGCLQPLEAFTFGSFASLAGIAILSFGTNSLTSALGALNILLYAGVYTLSKRQTIANTWLGSLVGGIPPLMGWAASCSDLHAGAWILAGILYSWQFPHFNALSWSYRPDYSRAGYRMMAVTDPDLCRRVTLRHSAAQLFLSLMMPLCNVTNWWFLLEITPINLYLTYLAWKFYRETNNNSSRKLFRFSLLHLPILMFLALINK